MKSVLAVLFLTLTSAMVFAVDNPDANVSTLKDTDIANINKQLDSCSKTNFSNNGMQDCVGPAISSSDKILNQVYNGKLADLKSQYDDDSKEVKRRLVASERAWVSYKDSQCSYVGSNELGGSDENLLISQCLLEMIQNRIVALRNGR